MLYQAALIRGDEGVRPQLGAVLDWSVLALVRTGRPDVAVVFLGILTQGALADVSNYLLTGAYRGSGDPQAPARDRRRRRGRCAHRPWRGMSYDEVEVYVLEQLAPVERVR